MLPSTWSAQVAEWAVRCARGRWDDRRMYGERIKRWDETVEDRRSLYGHGSVDVAPARDDSKPGRVE
jgi:hypothetical protein